MFNGWHIYLFGGLGVWGNSGTNAAVVDNEAGDAFSVLIAPRPRVGEGRGWNEILELNVESNKGS